jgi:hypothetical protein
MRYLRGPVTKIYTAAQLVGRIGSFIRSVTRDIRSDLLARVCQQSDDLAALLTEVCQINGGTSPQIGGFVPCPMDRIPPSAHDVVDDAAPGIAVP